ncbi:hypothetical protein GCM10027199_61480 [Amycolatopsis magusensis]
MRTHRIDGKVSTENRIGPKGTTCGGVSITEFPPASYFGMVCGSGFAAVVFRSLAKGERGAKWFSVSRTAAACPAWSVAVCPRGRTASEQPMPRHARGVHDG